MRSLARHQTGREEIVKAAIGLFGEGGIASTSLRAVARVAGVSPALVVHHFGGKDGLIAAADEAALREFGFAYSALDSTGGPDLLRRRAQETAAVMRDHPAACVYLGRALVEGTAGSARLFRLMIEEGRKEINRLTAEGALAGDADPLWATLQHFFLIWAPLSFLPLLEETLGGPLLGDEALDRWVSANVRLLREGIYR